MNSNAMGDKIAAARKRANMTQEELAHKLSVSRQSVSKWESGLAYPETEKLVRLCEVLGINADWLLRGDVGESGEPLPVQTPATPVSDDGSAKTPLTGGAVVFFIVCLIAGILLVVLSAVLLFGGFVPYYDITPAAVMLFFGIGLVILAVVIKLLLEKPGRK